MARGAAPPLDPEALREARLAARLSQAALARAVGTDRRQIIRYEQGQERPEIGRLSALARACSVTVADLVDEEALPPGLAGLRIGAGLTMAAAAAALAEHIDPVTGIATNRASLSYAEKGRLPLSWRPALAGSRVRGAMAATYEADIDVVRAAWEATFPFASRQPASRKETDRGESEAGFINATSNEGATQTPLPPLAETAALVWGSDRPASQAWRIRARIRQADGVEVEAVATGIEGSPPVVGWWTSHQGISRIARGQVIQVLEWSSPWRSMPDTAPDLPGARPTPPADTAQIPFDDHDQEHEQAATDQLPGAVVLVSGNPDADRSYLHIEVDGDNIGHMADLHTWNRQYGWAFYPRLTAQEQRAMTKIELGGRPPTATTTVIDIADAVRQILPQVLEQPVRIDSLHGHHTGLVGLHPQNMEGWELHHGRVSGREDVYARGRCWGWLQPATGRGRTAHTTTGPVPGGPWATREEAAVALWVHLTAPLPPPNLGERARTKRQIRAPRDTRPLCPYTDAELARVRLIRDRPEDQHSPYRAESPADHRVLGYVWRKDARRWAYASATGRPPEYSPALPTAPTRAAALEALLARPGPLWADPDSAIIH